jgi:hypothetical protein
MSAIFESSAEFGLKTGSGKNRTKSKINADSSEYASRASANQSISSSPSARIHNRGSEFSGAANKDSKAAIGACGENPRREHAGSDRSSARAGQKQNMAIGSCGARPQGQMKRWDRMFAIESGHTTR